MIWFLLQRRWPFTDVQCILALALEGFDSQAWQALLPWSLKASVRPVGEKKTPFQQTLTKVFHPRALASGMSTKHLKSKWVFNKSSFHSKTFWCLLTTLVFNLDSVIDMGPQCDVKNWQNSAAAAQKEDKEWRFSNFDTRAERWQFLSPFATFLPRTLSYRAWEDAEKETEEGSYCKH